MTIYTIVGDEQAGSTEDKHFSRCASSGSTGPTTRQTVAEMKRKAPEAVTDGFDLIAQEMLKGPWGMGLYTYKAFTDAVFGVPTVTDILAELEKPVRSHVVRKVTLSAMERDSHCRHGRTNGEISACFRSSTWPSNFMVRSRQTMPKHYRE
jgi:hypothetical protein